MSKSAIKFNLLMICLYLTAFTLAITIVAKIILVLLNQPILIDLFPGLVLAVYNLRNLCSLITITSMMLLMLTFAKWMILDDNFDNINSFFKTWKLRCFIKKGNGISRFNRSIKYDYLVFEDSNIKCVLKIPMHQEEALQLKKYLNSIFEYVSSTNTDFIFSNFERDGNYYILNGTLRSSN